MNADALKRMLEGKTGDNKVKMRKAPVSYKTPGLLPKEGEVKELKIYVDKKYETIIMPVFGIPVPYHIATIKNISFLTQIILICSLKSLIFILVEGYLFSSNL